MNKRLFVSLTEVGFGRFGGILGGADGDIVLLFITDLNYVAFFEISPDFNYADGKKTDRLVFAK